jgi:hypothetical protein
MAIAVRRSAVRLELDEQYRAYRREKRRLATKACRERQSKGRAITSIEYDDLIIALLVALGEITEAEAVDKKLVGKAITNTLRRAARRQIL